MPADAEILFGPDATAGTRRHLTGRGRRRGFQEARLGSGAGNSMHAPAQPERSPIARQLRATGTDESPFDSLTAVDQLNLTVGRRREIFGLVGPDRSREEPPTTMRLLTSIMETTSGEAWVAGPQRGAGRGGGKRARSAYMSQRFGLYPDPDRDRRILSSTPTSTAGGRAEEKAGSKRSSVCCRSAT